LWPNAGVRVAVDAPAANGQDSDDQQATPRVLFDLI